MQRILIVKLSSMGDVLHTMPAAQALRQRFPSAHLGWAIERGHSELLRGQDWLDEVIPWKRGAGPGHFAAFVRTLRRGRWDMAIDFQGLFRSGLVTWLSGAPRRIGYVLGREKAHWFYTDRVPHPTWDRHAVDRYHDLVGTLGARLPGLPLDRPYLDDRPPASDQLGTKRGTKNGKQNPSPLEGRGWERGETSNRNTLPQPLPEREGSFVRGSKLFPLHPSEEDRRQVDSWLAESGIDRNHPRLILINPDARRPANRWPPRNFAALAQQLASNPDHRVVLLAGPGAADLCQRVQREAGKGVLRADGRFGILGSAELIRRGAVLVTGDTGPMHLAAAVGTPTVALIGATHEQRTGPYASDAIILKSGIDCSPCYARRCPLHYDPPRCQELISVESVAEAVHLQLQLAESALQQYEGILS